MNEVNTYTSPKKMEDVILEMTNRVCEEVYQERRANIRIWK